MLKEKESKVLRGLFFLFICIVLVDFITSGWKVSGKEHLILLRISGGAQTLAGFWGFLGLADIFFGKRRVQTKTLALIFIVGTLWEVFCFPVIPQWELRQIILAVLPLVFSFGLWIDPKD